MHTLKLDRCIIDFETRSFAELVGKDGCGAYAYAEHPSTEIICMSYKFKGNSNYPSANSWVAGTPFPEEVLEHVRNGLPLEAHNAMFEIAIWYFILHKRMGFPMPKKWICTLSVAAYRALPLGLDAVGEAINLNTRKDKRGKYLLQTLSKPKKMTIREKKEYLQNNPDFNIDEDEFPLLFKSDEGLLTELYAYCDQDVETEDALGDAIGDLPHDEYEVWKLDQLINFRGVRVDLEAAEAAIKIAKQVEERLTREIVHLTDGVVDNPNSTTQVKDWLNANGLNIPNLQAATVKDYLDYPNLFEVEEGEDWKQTKTYRVLKIRSELSASSVSKYRKMILCANQDGRIRGMMQYHGASTGRFAGRLVQPHNLPRGDKRVLGAVEADNSAGIDGYENLISTIKLGDADTLEFFYGPAMKALSTAIRPTIMADSGKKLMVADFAGIEARGTPWVAGEEWKLEMFREFDRGEGPEGKDAYCITAEKVYGYEVFKKQHPEERQVGKICELAFGYGGGVNAWRNFDSSDRYTDEQVNEIKIAWRKANSKIVSSWYDSEDACLKTVLTGNKHSFRNFAFEMVEDGAGPWLTCILPNGRRLWYYNPRVEPVRMPWGDIKDSVIFYGKDSKRSGAWGKQKLYGGLIIENVVQAVSRDIMISSMFRIEKAGYPIIMTVHDEIIAEVDEDFGNQEEFEYLMCNPVPDFVKGFPIAVSGWSGKRYRKD